MEREKEHTEAQTSKTQLEPIFTPAKQQTLQGSQKSPFLTEKVTEKMRRIMDEFRKTRRVQMKKKVYGGESKWVFKTQLRVVSQIAPQKSLVFNKQAILPAIAASIKISQSMWQKQSLRLQQNKAKFQQIMQKFASLKGVRTKLKKKIVFCYIKKMKLKFLLAKNNEVDNELQTINDQIDFISTKNQFIKSQAEKNKKQFYELEDYKKQKINEIQRKSNLIAQISQQIKAKDQKIREISIKRLPNQKEICCCMFAVGILNEQLYILQLHKLLKRPVVPSDLQLKKIKNQKQMVATYQLVQDLNQHILKRKIRIDCRGSEIVVFKVFTVIYMHCKTMYLKNVASVMSKTSFFSQQFKQIYDFYQFQRYMINLIERFKGNQNLLEKQQDNLNYSYGRLCIVTGESEFRYLSWILKGFQYVSENHFCVRIGQNKTQIKLISSYQYSKMASKEKQAVLKVKFCELNKTSAFD